MTAKKIAIIGHGFVGKAVSRAFSSTSFDNELFIVDPAESELRIRDLPDDLDVAFVCVPTPVAPGGAVDTSIVRSVVHGFADRYNDFIDPPLLVIKSTVTPDHLNEWAHNYDRLLFNPEFLTEANSYRDFIYPRFHVIGRLKGSSSDISRELIEIYHYSDVSMRPPFHMTDFETASLVKYTINAYLALKVTFFNEMHSLAEIIDADWNTLRGIVASDERIGQSHTMVPGPDGKKGFGGSCFPKDTLALTTFADENGMFIETVETAIEVNNEIRCDYERDSREAINNIDFKKEPHDHTR